MKKKQSKGRRKSKSAYAVTAAVIKKVQKLAGQGLQNNQIAVSLGWSEATYYKIKASNTEFAEAVKRGELKGVRDVVNALRHRALGFDSDEQHREVTQSAIGKTIKQKTITKKVAPDTTAIIFYLVNRDPENWKHKNEQLLSGSLQVDLGKIKKADAKVIADVFDKITE